MRNKDYVEDSTKGSSLINPLNYKGDVLVQVWIDSRVLSTLTRWMDLKGEYAQHMSQAVRRPLEVMAEFLVNQGDVEMVDDTAEARSMLERRFNVDLNRGGRGTKNVMHNLALSDRRADLGRMLEKRKVEDVNVPKRVKINELVNKAVEMFNLPEVEERMKTIAEHDKKEQEELDRLINERSNNVTKDET